MGKGDIKSRKGKIAKGSFGVTRLRKKSKSAEAVITEKTKAKKAPSKTKK